MAAISVIGQVEIITLPEVTGETPLNARIDTGAKTSAIWASDISEADDGLHVTFFADEHEACSGESMVFTEYAETVVASSNGIAQRRYKVKLLVNIGDRRIRAWFTLADRSKQVYPILIGRNVLRGKFVVDVSIRNKNLSSAEKQRTKLLRKELEEQN
jgi:hypothetical protein